MSVAFYISGHGFGHASRQIEIINSLSRVDPGAGILVRSTAKRWLLDRTIAAPFTLDQRPTDTGVIQIDSLHLDPRATVEAAAEFYASFEQRIDEEAELLHAHDVRLVISDAPPLACAAAARAGIRSIVVANFTWDWIYQEYAEHLDLAPELMSTIQSAYRHASAAWRMPFHGGFETFTDVTDLPFVARHAGVSAADTRARLGLPAHRRLVLPSFGGYGVGGLDLDTIDLPGGWDVVRGLDQAEVYEAGLHYQDLVGAVDAVITKPGYGIVSECIANDTALVYTSRGRFREYEVFVAEMPRYLRCAYIDNGALLAGRWRAAIETAFDAPAPPERPRTDGAAVVADMMAACSAGASSSPPPPPR